MLRIFILTALMTCSISAFGANDEGRLYFESYRNEFHSYGKAVADWNAFRLLIFKQWDCSAVDYDGADNSDYSGPLSFSHGETSLTEGLNEDVQIMSEFNHHSQPTYDWQITSRGLRGEEIGNGSTTRLYLRYVPKAGTTRTPKIYIEVTTDPFHEIWGGLKDLVFSAPRSFAIASRRTRTMVECQLQR